MQHVKAALALVEGALTELSKWYASRKRRQMQQSSIGKAIAQGEGIHVYMRKPQQLKDQQEAAKAMQAVQNKAVHTPPKFSLKAIPGLLKDTVGQWNEDKAPQLAAALAYYTLFSLAPLLIIVIAVSGLVFGQQAAQNQIVGQIQGMVGQQGAEMIQTMIQNASRPAEGIVATIIGVVTLIFGAAGAMGQIKAALNTIWNVPPQKGPGGIKGILATLKSQLISFTMVLGIGFLLLVSLVLSAVIAGISQGIGKDLPTALMEAINFIISFGVITLLFGAIYKVLPDVKIDWRDVWIGAAITSLLFTVGKLLIGLYLGHSGTASSYGAAGSLIVLLLWVYYSAQILFFGAEFTQVYASQYGSQFEYSGATVPEQQQAKTPVSSRQTAMRRGAAS